MPWPCSPRRARARSATSRTSFTPAVTADSGSNALLVAPATRRAIVVLPVPGGPQSTTDDSRSASMSTRSGRPRPEQVLLADHLVERPGPQPGRERRPALEPLLDRGAEEVVGHRLDAYGRVRDRHRPPS